MSKGSSSRPLSVPREQFNAAFDSIFKQRTPEERAKDELGPFVQGSEYGIAQDGDVLIKRGDAVVWGRLPHK